MVGSVTETFHEECKDFGISSTEKHLVEDYRRAFGEDPPKVGAVAIMTDTDNTGEEAVAWYGAIRFLPPGP